MASVSLISNEFLTLVSRTIGEEIHLVLIQCIHPKKSVKAILRDQVELAAVLKPLDAREIRKNLSSELGNLMTKHLIHVQRGFNKDNSDIVAFTAWKYKTLTNWGEASAAREIALELDTSIHTIHYRLKLARGRGILPSPGSGSRLGI